jgi:hypothetical protein
MTEFSFSSLNQDHHFATNAPKKLARFFYKKNSFKTILLFRYLSQGGVMKLEFNLFSLFLLFLLLLGPRAPVRVVDGGVLQQGREDEDETHDLKDDKKI